MSERRQLAYIDSKKELLKKINCPKQQKGEARKNSRKPEIQQMALNLELPIYK